MLVVAKAATAAVVVLQVVLVVPLVADRLGLGPTRPEEQRFLDPSTLHLPRLVVRARLEEMVHVEVLLIVVLLVMRLVGARGRQLRFIRPN